jgi:hypothetical protein
MEGTYIKKHHFSNPARVPAQHWGTSLSEHTAKDQVNTFNRFTAFLGEDLLIVDNTHNQIKAFFFFGSLF